MLPNSWFKKEKPLPSMIGLGGGATGIAQHAGGVFDASGGIISDYSTPTAVYRSHVFTASGSLVVNSGSADVEYLVIGGGGGGGAGSGAGGGGAGGFRTNMTGHPNAPNNPQKFEAATGSYAIVVGKGGDSSHRNPIIATGQKGADSTITVSPTVTITSLGGGGGGCEGTGYYDGIPGGSGGGGCYNNSPGGEGGPDSQGYDGGTGGAGPPTSDWSGGGGGGAGGAASQGGTAPVGGGGEGSPGGAGLQCEIGGPANNLGMPGSSGFNWFGGGGGGGSQGHPSPTAVNPAGGGAAPDGNTYAGGGIGGRYAITPAAGKGRDGTGGGGGGCSPSTPDQTTDNAALTGTGPRVIGGPGGGAPGGYGIVVCRYEISALGGTAKATGGSISYYDGKVIHAFTNPGDFNVTSTIPSAEVVVIGGGGGGGWGALGDGGSGGGGAGAVLIHPAMPFGTGPNAVVIGEGGFGGYANRRGPIHNNKYGDQGESSTFAGLVALGGGYGNGQEGYPGGANSGGGDGGSGGGGSGGGSPGPGPGGSTANPPAYSGATVYDEGGGTGSGAPADYIGGGGGGAGQAGSGGSANPTGGWMNGPGGYGIQLPATFQDPYSGLGDPGTYGGGTAPTPGGFWVGGGGGAGRYSDTQPVGDGGSGGGGQGYGATSSDRDNRPQGNDGMRGTGGGGGGANYGNTSPYMESQAGQGGPGIVLVAYPE